MPFPYGKAEIKAILHGQPKSHDCRYGYNQIYAILPSVRHGPKEFRKPAQPRRTATFSKASSYARRYSSTKIFQSKFSEKSSNKFRCCMRNRRLVLTKCNRYLPKLSTIFFRVLFFLSSTYTPL